MTNEERAELNARVATAMGWQECHTTGGVAAGVPPGKRICDDNHEACPRYCEEWSAAGLVLDWLAGQGVPMFSLHFREGDGWELMIDGWSRVPECASPQEAVCRGVLAWHAAGQPKD